MKTAEQQFHNPCPQCPKKQQLIQKYTNLIDLLKKKNDASNNSVLPKPIDQANSNSTSLLTSSKLCRALLAFKLLQLEQKGKKQVFEVLRQLIVEQKCHKGFKMVQALDRCIGRRTQEAFRFIWINKNKHLAIIDNQSLEKSKNLAILDTSQPLRNVSCLLPGQPISLNEKTRNLSRKLFALSHQITILNAEKKALIVQIDQNMRRQQIESKKKKQSLEMLGEEMAEKNQLIAQLQQALQFYEAKLGKIGGNVLEDDSIAIKKELQALEKVNQKINIQLEKRGEQLSKCQEQLKSLSEKNSKLQTENVSLKQKNFELGLELQGLQKKKKEYYSLSSFLQRKISSLKKYQKLISTNLKALEQCSLNDKSSFNNSIKPRNSRLDLQDGQHNGQEKQQNPAFSPISCFQAQYKIQKVLNYIFNIQLEDVWIKNDQKLFDSQELQVLNGLKLKFIQLNDQVKALSKPKAVQKAEIAEIKPSTVRLSQQYGQSDEVYFNRHHISGSIFDVLGTQKNNKDKDNDQIVSQFECLNCQRCGVANAQTTSRKGQQNFTIRLLELELQKSKQVEKISELKNKLMHIRCIVINFIKTLDIRSLSKQAKEIIEIFCEFFEYSQEEKQMIYQLGKKQKKFLGWF